MFDWDEIQEKAGTWLARIVGIFLLWLLFYGLFVDHSSACNRAANETLASQKEVVLSPINTIKLLELRHALYKDPLEILNFYSIRSYYETIPNLDFQIDNGTTLLIALGKGFAPPFYARSDTLTNRLFGTFKQMVDTILGRNINLNMRDTSGKTALIWSTIMGCTAQYLNSNISDRKGNLEVWKWAYYDYHFYLDSVLIANEAAMNIKDNQGYSATDYALAFNNDNYLQLFIRNTETLEEFKNRKLLLLRNKLPDIRPFIDYCKEFKRKYNRGRL